MLEVAGGIILAVLVLIFWRGLFALTLWLVVAVIGLALLAPAAFLLYSGAMALPDIVWTSLSYAVAAIIGAIIVVALPLYVLYVIGATVWAIVTYRPLVAWKAANMTDLEEQ